MSKRPKMMASLVREIIAVVLRDCPPECGIASITEVEVSDDFSVATVFVSSLSEQDVLIEFLRSRQSQLQHQLASQMTRARIPQLRFRLDPRIERGNRIDELLES